MDPELPTAAEVWAQVPANLQRGLYQYTTLSEAVEVPPRVPGEGMTYRSIFAAVAECSAGRPTRGTDWVSNLVLVDPSTDQAGMGAGVELLVFGAEGELPHVRRMGDIIRMHRVQVNQYNGKLQLIGKIGKPFHYSLWDATSEEDAPYQVSSRTYTHDEHSRAILATLRVFQAHLLEEGPNQLRDGGLSAAYLRRIKDVRPKDFCDIVCKVLWVEGDSLTDGVLFVWDGTDALPMPPKFDSREGQQDGSVSAEDADNALRNARTRFLPVQDGEGRALDLPPSGSALPVVMYNMTAVRQKGSPQALPRKVPLPAVGTWVKLRNLGAWVVQGQLQCLYHPATKWTPWQPDEEALAEADKRIDSNHVAGWAPENRDLLLARTPNSQPFETLRQVLGAIGTGTPAKFHCLVRVVDVLPPPDNPAAFCCTKASMGISGADSGEFMYALRLRLQDATAELDALLGGDAGAQFFQGIPPQDLSANPEAAAQLGQRVATLLGEDCAHAGGPWMECCIRMYFLDCSRPWHSCQFKVVDTALVA